MTNKEYREHEGISSTEIKMMQKSMAHYKWFKDHPEDKDSSALLFGRVYHKWVLEPSDFYNEFAVIPNCDRRTKEGKETYAKFLEETKDKDIVTEEMFKQVCDMRDVLYATPYARKILYGSHEQSFFWEDEKSGLMCKCRPDSFGEIGGQGICVDLKTCQCAETSRFMKSAMDLGYDIQASHYVQGLKANLNKDFLFIFVAQEKTPPYAVNILQADDFFMKQGAEVREYLLEYYKKCVDKNEYPSYMGFTDEVSINQLSVPSWLKKVYESEE